MTTGKQYETLLTSSKKLLNETSSAFQEATKNVDKYDQISTQINERVLARLAKNNQYSQIFNTQVHRLNVIHSDINTYLIDLQKLAEYNEEFAEELDKCYKLSDYSIIQNQVNKFLNPISDKMFKLLDKSELDLSRIKSDIDKWEKVFGLYRPDAANQKRLNEIFSQDASEMYDLCDTLHNKLKTSLAEHTILVNSFNKTSGFNK
tara:strand:+ start:324 stop:938 length:615 start_codon:yes stop_codon:yes gene_type:complete